jgi:CRP/FNR family transcriptional regulator, cyclic AMP receptor protein
MVARSIHGGNQRPNREDVRDAAVNILGTLDEVHMQLRDRTHRAPGASATFDAPAFFASVGLGEIAVEFGRGEPIFVQGEPCDSVLYIQRGGVKLSVVSKAGKEAVVAMLEPGDFFGEGCLAGQAKRMGSATAITPSTILFVGKDAMVRLLHQQHAMSDRFISHLLARNIRTEEALLDQLFNSSEKRLARTLLLLAHDGPRDEPMKALPKISQETLAGMVGTTRSRVSLFLNKFKKLGFIDYDDGALQVHTTLLSVVLHE